MVEQQVRAFVALSAFVSVFVVAPLAYMMADNQPPYEYDVRGSYIIPSRSPAGRQISVHWELRRVNRICPGTITRSIVDQRTGERMVYDPTLASRSVQPGDGDLERTFLLPDGISPGMKWYYAEGNFACNPLQRVYPLRVITPKLSFEVTP